MRKLLAFALTALLVACNSGGTGGPPPPPTPSPTPASCGGSVTAPNAARGAHIMLPKGAPAPASSGPLVYNGGSVLPIPEVYVVFWGFGASDPVAQRLTQLYANVGGSSWFDTVTQYCQNPDEYIQNPTGILGGAWSDMTDKIPSKPTQAQIAQEAINAATHFSISDISNDTVVVVSASGHNEVGFGTQFCGWHTNTDWAGGSMSFEYLPYIPDVGSGCGANSVNQGSAGKLDGVSIVGGHELAESVTDPIPATGWSASGGGEIGDLCAWKDLQNVTFGSVTLPMQPLYSNDASGCVQ